MPSNGKEAKSLQTTNPHLHTYTHTHIQSQTQKRIEHCDRPVGNL